MGRILSLYLQRLNPLVFKAKFGTSIHGLKKISPAIFRRWGRVVGRGRGRQAPGREVLERLIEEEAQMEAGPSGSMRAAEEEITVGGRLFEHTIDTAVIEVTHEEKELADVAPPTESELSQMRRHLAALNKDLLGSDEVELQAPEPQEEREPQALGPPGREREESLDKYERDVLRMTFELFDYEIETQIKDLDEAEAAQKELLVHVEVGSGTQGPQEVGLGAQEPLMISSEEEREEERSKEKFTTTEEENSEYEEMNEEDILFSSEEIESDKEVTKISKTDKELSPPSAPIAAEEVPPAQELIPVAPAEDIIMTEPEIVVSAPIEARRADTPDYQYDDTYMENLLKSTQEALPSSSVRVETPPPSPAAHKDTESVIETMLSNHLNYIQDMLQKHTDEQKAREKETKKALEGLRGEMMVMFEKASTVMDDRIIEIDNLKKLIKTIHEENKSIHQRVANVPANLTNIYKLINELTLKMDNKPNMAYFDQVTEEIKGDFKEKHDYLSKALNFIFCEVKKGEKLVYDETDFLKELIIDSFNYLHNSLFPPPAPSAEETVDIPLGTEEEITVSTSESQQAHVPVSERIHRRSQDYRGSFDFDLKKLIADEEAGTSTSTPSIRVRSHFQELPSTAQITIREPSDAPPPPKRQKRPRSPHAEDWSPESKDIILSTFREYEQGLYKKRNIVYSDEEWKKHEISITKINLWLKNWKPYGTVLPGAPPKPKKYYPKPFMYFIHQERKGKKKEDPKSKEKGIE